MATIAIVVQRYGLEVNGGAEFHARVLAEKLSLKHKVEVLTTKAKDHISWEDAYHQDTEIINKVTVKRFSSKSKNLSNYKIARKRVLYKLKIHKVLRFIYGLRLAKKYFPSLNPSPADCDRFVIEQGPYCPDLLTYIKENCNNYDSFIFFTYLFYPTYYGLDLVPNKAIFIPTAHNEPLLFSKPYENLFSKPKYILYNTLSEQTLVKKHFKKVCPNDAIVGIGVTPFDVKPEFVSPSHHYNFKYFVYIGRIESAKGCDKLIQYFTKGNFNNIKLILIGNNSNYINTIKNPNIIFTGFVDENTKYYLLDNALGLIIPSQNESLSIVTLESMLHKKPVIANAACEVLKDHIEKSKSGFLFQNQSSFNEAISTILNLSAKDLQTQQEQAYNYVTSHYSWDIILQKVDQAIAFVIGSKTN